MRRRMCLLPVLVLFLFCILVQGCFAWTVQEMRVKPASGPVAPGTPVTVSYTVHFDSWMSEDGYTFDSDHSLDMFTDLEDAKWTVGKVETPEDADPITTSLASKTGVRYRIDGWTLSYHESELDLHVTLQGTAPKITGERTMIRIEEMDEGAGIVAGSVKTVKYLVAVPTTAATVKTPAPVTTSSTMPATTTPTPTPTVKKTYSPGPDALVVMGILGIVGIVVCRKGN